MVMWSCEKVTFQIIPRDVKDSVEPSEMEYTKVVFVAAVGVCASRLATAQQNAQGTRGGDPAHDFDIKLGGDCSKLA